MVRYEKKDIIYSFKYGGYVSKKTKIVLLIIPIFIVLLGLVIFTVLILNKEKGAWESLILSIIGLIFLFLILYLYFKTRQHDKEILIWLDDENLYETKVIPWEFSNKVIGFATYYRFGIDFKINENSYKKISLGYDAFYKAIKDREITILYSPKYDQVLVLKV